MIDQDGNMIEESFDVEVFESVICRPISFEVDASNDSNFIFSQNIGNGLSYEWDFGDGIIEMNSSSQVEHEYTTPGIYTACITVPMLVKSCVRNV